MKQYLLLSFFIVTAVITVLVLYSCKPKPVDKGTCGVENTSYKDSTSHNFGINCVNCHREGGNGKGCYSVCGSVTDSGTTNPLAGCIVKLYTGPKGTGTLRTSLEVDKTGNVHTTKTVDFSGLYPVVIGPTGKIFYMNSNPKNGACNSCHGVTTSKIYAR